MVKSKLLHSFVFRTVQYIVFIRKTIPEKIIAEIIRKLRVNIAGTKNLMKSCGFLKLSMRASLLIGKHKISRSALKIKKLHVPVYVPLFLVK